MLDTLVRSRVQVKVLMRLLAIPDSHACLPAMGKGLDALAGHMAVKLQPLAEKGLPPGARSIDVMFCVLFGGADRYGVTDLVVTTERICPDVHIRSVSTGQRCMANDIRPGQAPLLRCRDHFEGPGNAR